MKQAMRGPAMRAFSVCPACCSVHATGAACPTCAGVEDPLEAERAAAAAYVPRSGHRRGVVIGACLGLAAFSGILVLLMVSGG